MSRVLVVVGFIVVGALALLTVATTGSDRLTDTGTAAEGQSSGAVTIRSDTSPDRVFWLRLRWLLAGAGITSVALVGLRQYRVFARYQLGLSEPVRAGRLHRRTDAQPETPQPATGLPAPSFSFDWMVERAPSSAGD